MAQSYHKIATQGSGRIAYVFHVSGYPWAVCTDTALVTALGDGSANAKLAREAIFGTIKWGSTVCPAWTAPIFPTLSDNVGSEYWRIDETKGVPTSGGWSVQIQDDVLGHQWEHKASGDTIWGIEGVHRVARLEDSTIHGWGFLDDNFMRTVDGAAPITIAIDEQSSDKIHDRADSLSGSEYLVLWCEHEAFAVSGIYDSGTWPEYSLTIEDSGDARGLYKSRIADHRKGTDIELLPIVRDVPDSIIDGYAWLYGIPLDEDGNLVLDSNDEPIVAIEKQGVVSPDIVTKNGVTSIRMLPITYATRLDVEIAETVQNVEVSLDKYVICRGENSGTTEASIIPYWQSPHLIVAANSPPWYSDYPTTIPIWLCKPGEVKRFNSYRAILDALLEELELVFRYDDAQNTGYGTSGDFAKPIMAFYDNPGGFIGTYAKEGLDWRINGVLAYSGPLAWILGIGDTAGTEITSQDHAYPQLAVVPWEQSFYREFKNDYNVWLYNVECVGRKMSERIQFKYPQHWMVPRKAPEATPSDWIFTHTGIQRKSPFDNGPGQHAEYYYQWDWIDNPLPEWEEWAAYETFPDYAEVCGSNKYFYYPKVGSWGQSPDYRLYVKDDTDSNSFIDEEWVYLGRDVEQDGAPQLKGKVDGDLPVPTISTPASIEFDNDRLTVVGDGTFPLGGSIFYHPYMQSMPEGKIEDAVDPYKIRKAMYLEGISFSDIVRTLFGETRNPLVLAPELQLSHCPFFTTIEDFISVFDYESMDAVVKPFSEKQHYSLSTSDLKSVYDILKNEILLHGTTMTREWDFSNNQYVFRFRPIQAMNKSLAFQTGRKLDEYIIGRENKSEEHNFQQIANKIRLEYAKDQAINISSDRAATIHSERRTIVIKPAISKFDVQGYDSDFRAEIVAHFGPLLRTLSRKRVAQNATLTRRGLFVAQLGQEALMTDPAARIPFTHELGLDDEPIKITGWTYNMIPDPRKGHTIDIAYTLGGDASYGWAPACLIEAGNFTKNGSQWTGTPNDHEYTLASGAKDLWYFDCYDLLDPENPVPRNCSCGNYEVIAVEKNTHGFTPLPFDCYVYNDSGTYKLRFLGSTSGLDLTKDYYIYFADYDSCQSCQKYYIFGADGNYTLGAGDAPARRWIS